MCRLWACRLCNPPGFVEEHLDGAAMIHLASNYAARCTALNFKVSRLSWSQSHGWCYPIWCISAVKSRENWSVSSRKSQSADAEAQNEHNSVVGVRISSDSSPHWGNRRTQYFTNFVSFSNPPDYLSFKPSSIVRRQTAQMTIKKWPIKLDRMKASTNRNFLDEFRLDSIDQPQSGWCDLIGCWNGPLILCIEAGKGRRKEDERVR